METSKLTKIDLIAEISEEIQENELALKLNEKIETNIYGSYRDATEIDPPEYPDVEASLDDKEYVLTTFKVGVLTVEVDDDTDMDDIASQQFTFQGDLYVEFLGSKFKLFFTYKLNSDELELVELYDLRK